MHDWCKAVSVVLIRLMIKWVVWGSITFGWFMSRHYQMSLLHNPLQSHESLANHFLPKKDVILPCPAFAPCFFPLPLAVDGAIDAGVFGLVGSVGSSSEKDSQAGSSFVTRRKNGG